MSDRYPLNLPRRMLGLDLEKLQHRVHRDWRSPPLICDECGSQPVILAGNESVYGRVRGAWPFVYVCLACRAYIGLHRGSLYPLGTMANPATRAARARLHAAFDPLWRSGSTSRRRAYRALAKALEAPSAHISEMSSAQCARAMSLLNDIEAELTAVA